MAAGAIAGVTATCDRTQQEGLRRIALWSGRRRPDVRDAHVARKGRRHAPNARTRCADRCTPRRRPSGPREGMQLVDELQPRFPRPGVSLAPLLRPSNGCDETIV